jgi:hypothetical protein
MKYLLLAWRLGRLIIGLIRPIVEEIKQPDGVIPLDPIRFSIGGTLYEIRISIQRVADHVRNGYMSTLSKKDLPTIFPDPRE